MNTIKNLALIEGLLSQDDLRKLEHGAGLHKRHSRITFKILSVETGILTIRVTQDKNPAENYFDSKRLIEITKELFGHFFSDYKINVRAFEYEQPVVNVVNTEWIKKQMYQSGITLKEIEKDSGIDYTSLSAIINGKKVLSQSMRAFFYYYFDPRLFIIDQCNFNQIRDLIIDLGKSEDQELKKKIRKQLRELNFYISRFESNKSGFNVGKFDLLVKNNIIKLV